MGLSSFTFLQWAPKDTSFLQQSAYRPFKVIQGRSNRKRICDFLSCTISEIWRLIGWKLQNFPTQSYSTPLFPMFLWTFVVSLMTLTKKKLVMELYSSEDHMIVACHWHSTSMWWTEGQTGRRMVTDRFTIASTVLCIVHSKLCWCTVKTLWLSKTD